MSKLIFRIGHSQGPWDRLREMKGVDSTLLNIALAVAILGGSAVVTHLFARAMYIRCPECHTLNARRRVRCRHCGQELRARAGGEGAEGRFANRPANAQKRQS